MRSRGGLTEILLWFRSSSGQLAVDGHYESMKPVDRLAGVRQGTLSSLSGLFSVTYVKHAMPKEKEVCSAISGRTRSRWQWSGDIWLFGNSSRNRVQSSASRRPMDPVVHGRGCLRLGMDSFE